MQFKNILFDLFWLTLFSFCSFFVVAKDEPWQCPEQGWEELNHKAIDETYVDEVKRWLKTPGLEECNINEGEAWLANIRLMLGNVDSLELELKNKINRTAEPLAAIPLILALGEFYQLTGNYSASIEQFERVLAFHLPPSLTIKRGYSYINIAQSYSWDGNRVAAISWARKALSVPALLENAEAYSEALVTTTNIYLEEQLLEPAFELLLESTQLEEQLRHRPYILSVVYDYLAVISRYMGRLQTSLHYAQQAGHYCSELKGGDCSYFAHLRLGSAYTDLGLLDKALIEFETANSLLHLIDNHPFSIQFFNLQYANLLSLRGDKAEALVLLDKALKIAPIKEDLSQFYGAYNQKRVAEIYSNLGMYQQASEWAYSYADALNEWQTKRNSGAIVSMFDELSEARHQKEIEEIEKQAMATQKALELAAIERDFQFKVQIYQLAAVFFLLALASYALHNRHKWKLLAKYDALTHTLSRGPLLDEGDKLVAKNQTELYALMLFDFDYFKRINDSYGHPAGDRVLQEISERITSNVKKGDLFGRLGGEEFMFVGCFEQIKDIQLMAERLLHMIRNAPVNYDGLSLEVTVSIGVAIVRKEESDLSMAYGRADNALYRAKESGRDQIAYHEDDFQH